MRTTYEDPKTLGGRGQGFTNQRWPHYTLTPPALPDSRPVLIVTPNAPPIVCGVGDYSERLLKLIPGAVLASRRYTKDSSQVVHGLPGIVRWLLATRSSIVVLQFTPFGYMNIPVQPYALVVAILGRALGARLILIWHEPPSQSNSPLAAARVCIESLLVRLADVILISDEAWAPTLERRGGRVSISPIPSPFERPTAPTRTLESLPCFVLFGISTSVKHSDPEMFEKVRDIVLDRLAATRFVAIGKGWEPYSAMDVEVLGVIPRERIREELRNFSAALFPTNEPRTAKSSSVAVLLEAGVPIVSLGHGGANCPTCSYFQDSVVCVTDPRQAADALTALATRSDIADEQRDRGSSFYAKNLSWAKVDATIRSALRDAEKGREDKC